MSHKKPVKKRKLNPQDTSVSDTPTTLLIESKTDSLGIFSSAQISIGSWNVGGIRSCIKKDRFLDNFNQERFDVMCFNETRMQEGMVESFKGNFPQYNYQYWECSKIKKGYSGVAILSKVEPISVKSGMNNSKYDNEGRVLTAEFDSFYVVCTYMPNSGKDLSRLNYRVNEWDTDLRAYLKSLEQTGKGVIWIGDMNIIHQELDIWKMPEGSERYASVNIEERESFGILLKEGWVDTFRYKYPELKKFSFYSTYRTGWREIGRGWRLDYAVVNPTLIPRIVDAPIHDNVIASDHHPIELIITNPKYENVDTVV